MDKKLVSISEFASQHAVSRTTVRRWRERGLLAMIADKVDVGPSNRKLAERPRHYRGGAAKDRAGTEYDRCTAALGIALKRLIASDRKSGSLDELIESVNAVLKTG